MSRRPEFRGVREPLENERLLKRIQRAATGTAEPDHLVQEIASQSITRDRSCDGKSKFRTPARAESAVKRGLLRDVALRSYFCPFCECYHVTSRA